jgi:hypothetical protein
MRAIKVILGFHSAKELPLYIAPLSALDMSDIKLLGSTSSFNPFKDSSKAM